MTFTPVVTRGNVSIPERLLKSKQGLFNYSQKRGDEFVKVEDCLVNDIALRKVTVDGVSVELEPHNELQMQVDYPNAVNTISELHDKLMPYQIDDVLSMLHKSNVLNRNPMGMGKTVETVVLMRALSITTALIVCPKSVMLQWKRSIEAWYPDVAYRVQIKPKEPKSGMICIYNYESISTNADLLSKLQKVKWQMHICDEAHRIKNPKSKRTVDMKAVKSERRVALTGTPITNRPNDLWSILHWLDHRYSGRSYWNFTYYFCNIERGLWGDKITGLTKDESRIETLQELLQRTSVWNPSTVAKNKTVVTVPLAMDTKQTKLFKDTKKLIFEELPETMTIANGAVLATRLQQITSWPKIFDDENHKYTTGAKFEWVEEFLEDNPEEKVVIFSRFATVVEAFAKELSVKCVAYTGQHSRIENDKAKDLFINNPEVRVILGTIGAMGEGVDGLQTVSRTAIFIDRDWGPSTMEQAEDRLNRYGQTQPVMCYYLECEKSFDKHIGKVNLNKAEDIRRALEDDS